MDINSDVGFCDGGSFPPVEELFDKFTEVTTSLAPPARAASAKAGERVRVRVDTRTIPLTFLLSPKRRGD